MVFKHCKERGLHKSGWHPTWCRHKSCSHRHKHHDWTPDGQPQDFFNSHAKDLNDIDSKYQEYCEKNHNEGVKVLYGFDFYRILIPLVDFNEDDIEVKTKHRVISIKAKNAASKTFSEVRILPEIVSISKATWCFQNKQLEVRLMYNVRFNEEMQTSCSSGFDDEEVVVLKGDEATCDCNPQDNSFLCFGDYATTPSP